MKRLALTVALIAAFWSFAFAHQGSIGLYTDQTATDCDATFVEGVQTNLYLIYYRGTGGPDGISGASFSIEYIGDDEEISYNITWPPDTWQIGSNLNYGISTIWEDFVCAGVGSDYVWIATIGVIVDDLTGPFTLRVRQSQAVVFPPLAGHPEVTDCSETFVLHGVLGGAFSHPDGTCDVGMAPSSWGAIKSMYRR